VSTYSSESASGSARIQQSDTSVGPSDERSLGELVASATSNISTLMRKELELAKVEIKQEAVNAGKGAAGLGAAAFTGLLALIFLSIALAYAIGSILGDHIGLGFLVVGLLYLIVAGIAALVGKKSLKKVGPPEKTIETLKDDVAFAKHPTSNTH